MCGRAALRHHLRLVLLLALLQHLRLVHRLVGGGFLHAVLQAFLEGLFCRLLGAGLRGFLRHLARGGRGGAGGSALRAFLHTGLQRGLGAFAHTHLHRGLGAFLHRDGGAHLGGLHGALRGDAAARDHAQRAAGRVHGHHLAGGLAGLFPGHAVHAHHRHLAAEVVGRGHACTDAGDDGGQARRQHAGHAVEHHLHHVEHAAQAGQELLQAGASAARLLQLGVVGHAQHHVVHGRRVALGGGRRCALGLGGLGRRREVGLGELGQAGVDVAAADLLVVRLVPARRIEALVAVVEHAEDQRVRQQLRGGVAHLLRQRGVVAHLLERVTRDRAATGIQEGLLVVLHDMERVHFVLVQLDVGQRRGFELVAGDPAFRGQLLELGLVVQHELRGCLQLRRALLAALAVDDVLQRLAVDGVGQAVGVQVQLARGLAGRDRMRHRVLVRGVRRDVVLGVVLALLLVVGDERRVLEGLPQVAVGDLLVVAVAALADAATGQVGVVQPGQQLGVVVQLRVGLAQIGRQALVLGQPLEVAELEAVGDLVHVLLQREQDLVVLAHRRLRAGPALCATAGHAGQGVFGHAGVAEGRVARPAHGTHGVLHVHHLELGLQQVLVPPGLQRRHLLGGLLLAHLRDHGRQRAGAVARRRAALRFTAGRCLCLRSPGHGGAGQDVARHLLHQGLDLRLVGGLGLGGIGAAQGGTGGLRKARAGIGLDGL